MTPSSTINASSRLFTPNRRTASRSSSPAADEAPSSLDQLLKASASAAAQSSSAVPSIPSPPATSDETGAQASGEEHFIDLDRSSRLNVREPSPIVPKVDESGPLSLLNSSVTAPPSTRLETTSEADQTINAQVAEHDKFIAQLDKRIIELQLAMDTESDLRANSKYLVVNFCRILMKLASELRSGSHQSAEYIIQQILSEGGGVLTDLGSADFSRRIEIFSRKVSCPISCSA